MGDAHEPGRGGEGVFFRFIRQRSRNEHDRAVGADQEKRGRHLSTVVHAKLGIMLGLREQIVERCELAWRLHRRNLGALQFAAQAMDAIKQAT